MKMQLTRAMVDELIASEVETFEADWGAVPEQCPTVGRWEFCAAVSTSEFLLRHRPTAKSVPVNLTGDALAYAANDRWGPFATRADILRDWGPEWQSMARAFDARQRAAAAELGA